MNKHNQINVFLGIALLLFVSTACGNDSYTAKVVGVTDGDTIKVIHGGKQIRIRLYGIDTPEKRQAFGNKAKRFTADQVTGQVVTIIPMDQDRYGRIVALVRPPGKTVTLNEDLVKNGYAWVYRKYCRADFCPDWISHEKASRTAGLGLWTDPDPVPPWEYRRR